MRSPVGRQRLCHKLRSTTGLRTRTIRTVGERTSWVRQDEVWNGACRRVGRTISTSGVLLRSLPTCIDARSRYCALVPSATMERTLDPMNDLPRSVTQDRFGIIPAAGRVRGVFLFEPEEEQISANLSLREQTGGDMTVRAHVSWLLGEALRLECERVGVPTLTARPWPTLLHRVRAALL